jgi:hypothetical protein
MVQILLDNFPLVLLLVVIFFLLFNFFPIVFFLCFVVPFLILKTGYHSLVKYFHEHSLWWDIPLILIIVLSFLLIVFYASGYRY